MTALAFQAPFAITDFFLFLRQMEKLIVYYTKQQWAEIFHSWFVLGNVSKKLIRHA